MSTLPRHLRMRPGPRRSMAHRPQRSQKVKLAAFTRMWPDSFSFTASFAPAALLLTGMGRGSSCFPTSRLRVVLQHACCTNASGAERRRTCLDVSHLHCSFHMSSACTRERRCKLSGPLITSCLPRCACKPFIRVLVLNAVHVDVPACDQTLHGSS